MQPIAALLIVSWFGAAFLLRGRLRPVLLPPGVGGGGVALARAPVQVPTPQPRYWDPPRSQGWSFEPTDVLLPVAVAAWAVSLRSVDLGAVDDWGLLHALPITFFVALGLLVASIALALSRPAPSAVRLVLHLVALVVVLHATVPLLFPEPNYPWVYKHIGVTGYINAHGSLNSSVDIYQNWPGFFALAAWFTRIAGVGSPLAFAKWAPVYFNLLNCLELAFVFRWLPLARRERWLGLFLFAAGNWVGQDYFAPQALGFVLSMAVFAMVLVWLRTDALPAPVRLVRGMARWALRAAPPIDEEHLDRPRLDGWSRAAALAALIGTFAVLVVVHQLSPFLVLLGAALLAAGGMVRPHWVVAVLAALALSYFAVHLAYLRSEGHLAGSPFDPREIIASLSNPFDNAHSSGFASTNPMRGREVTALGAPALILGLWLLGCVGALRRLRAGRRTLLLAVLASSPALLAVGQNYGGEAIFRIYLFSLPWTAALVASAFVTRTGRWRPEAFVGAGLVLATVVALFMSSFYGSVELYRVRPGSVEASQYYFDHAPPGSALGLLSPNVPGRIGANYDQYVKGTTPLPLSSITALQHRVLGPADLPMLRRLYREHLSTAPGGLFLSLSTDQETYVRVLGLMPAGAVPGLDQALAQSAEWTLFYRNDDAAIYQYVGG